MKREMFHTTNLKAASALVTLGFELLIPPVTRTVRHDGVESTVFWFEPINKEGKKAIEVYRDMTKGSEKLRASDPENPINYMREVLSNRDELISLIRNVPRHVIINRNGRSIAIREDATKEQKDQFKPYL
jgi:hypothetical protein